jgi:hypothetical protein
LQNRKKILLHNISEGISKITDRLGLTGKGPEFKIIIGGY